MHLRVLRFVTPNQPTIQRGENVRIYINGRFDEIPEPRTDQLVRTMTRAEYDQLTTEEKEGLILIADEDSSKQIVYSVSRSDIYSEEEKIVGRWVDGKPLYRKIFVTAGSYANGTVMLTDVDTVCYVGGCFVGADLRVFDFPSHSSNATCYEVKFVNNEVLMSVSGFSGVVSTSFHVEYTKVDDEPETAETAMNLTKYSTEEQIVGTWIDDKPVYRRIFPSVEYDTPFVNDIDALVKATGYVQDDTGAIYELPDYETYSRTTFILKNNSLSLTRVGYQTAHILYVLVEYTKLTD